MTKAESPNNAPKTQREQTTAEFMDGLSIEELLAIRRKSILNSVLLALVTIAFEIWAITMVLPYARAGVLFTVMGFVLLGTLGKLLFNAHRIRLANDRIDPIEAQKNFD